LKEFCSRVAVGCLSLASAMLLGCGSNEPFDFVPVTGKVVYEDGSPLTGGQLQFVSLAPAVGANYPRPAAAHLKSDGTFDAVTSHKYGDGLVPGKHKVAILNGRNADGKPLVPQEYTSSATTPLVIDTADAPLVIIVPRP